LTVGLINDVTGQLSFTNGLAVEEAALKAANAAGGVDGYKFAWKTYDTTSTPAGGLIAARAAVADHVFAVIASWALPDTGLPTIAAAGIPTIGDGDGTAWSGPPDLFSVIGNGFSGGVSTAFFAPLIQRGYTRIALPGGTINPAIIPAYEKAVAGSGGSVCFSRVGIDGTNTASITALAHEIIGAHCQGVFSATLYPGTLQLQIALNQLGAHIPVVDLVDSGPSVIKQAGTSANNLIYANDFATAYNTSDPGIVQFLSQMKTYEPTANVYCGNCIKGYVAAEWFLKALGELNGAATQQGLIAALNSTKNYTADNLVGPINEPAFHTTGYGLCFAALAIENGNWVPLESGSFPFICGQPFAFSKP
jgi:ABC-type branched-subunit amino acid transport system substrate-binding protein